MTPHEQLAEWVAQRERREALERTNSRAVEFPVSPGTIMIVAFIVLGLGLLLEPGKGAGSRAATSSVATSPGHVPSGASIGRPATRSAADMSYAEQRSRHHELGNKYYPTQEEIREGLLLDGRLSVQEGKMSKEAFERYTKEKY